MPKPHLLSLSKAQLSTLLHTWGEPSFRAGQIFTWLHRGASIDEMSNLPKSLRQKLESETLLHYPEIEQKLVSRVDGTIKYLFRLSDGECVESVFMRYAHGNTLCVSSQVGCRMGCRFCASTLCGLCRNLEAGEILGQVICAQKDTGMRISNIVMMGIGEPLDNYDNVLQFLHIVNEEGGLCIGHRHISLSTCGLVDGIDRLAEEDLQITLSISLHAATDEVRSAIMPINRKWNLQALLDACGRYFEKTGRRISFEYTLIAGQNDSAQHALALADTLNQAFGDRMPIHVNLIPLNPVEERSFCASDRIGIDRFVKTLNAHRINATVRRKLGPDINASCGQLRHRAKSTQL